jgi:hypothetical protein
VAKLILTGVSAGAALKLADCKARMGSYSPTLKQVTLEDAEARLVELDKEIFALAGNVAWSFQYDDGRVESGAKDGIFAALWNRLTGK